MAGSADRLRSLREPDHDVMTEEKDCHDQTPRSVPDRLAGGTFAFAADPSLLVADARDRGWLQYRGSAARGFCEIRVASVDAWFRRRQCPPPAQGACAGVVYAGPAPPRGRRRQ